MSNSSSPKESYNPNSFGDTFKAMARESLVKNQREHTGNIISISALLLALAAVAVGLYLWLQNWLCLIPLVLILILMWIRHTMSRQIAQDFAELAAAKKAWSKTRDTQYLCFIAERTERVLRENKALTRDARQRIKTYRDYATQRLKK